MSFELQNLLPISFLRRMEKSERKPLGKAGILNQEAQALADRRSERQLQEQVAALCRQRNLFFIQSRMDKATTVRKGLFDFTIFIPSRILHGTLPPFALAVECKVKGGKISEDQQYVFSDFHTQTGYPVHIIRSLAQFKELLDAHHP